MKSKLKKAYMDTAWRFSQLSTARRLKVGAIIVKDNRIISIGYNGTPAGWDNNCEDEIYVDNNDYQWLDLSEIWHQYPHQSHDGRHFKMVTKPEVIHAESNALIKLARSPENGVDADMFVTHAPCLDCAKLIYQTGIRRVFYKETYRNQNGLDFLRQAGIEVEKIGNDTEIDN